MLEVGVPPWGVVDDELAGAVRPDGTLGCPQAASTDTETRTAAVTQNRPTPHLRVPAWALSTRLSTGETPVCLPHSPGVELGQGAQETVVQ